MMLSVKLFGKLGGVTLSIFIFYSVPSYACRIFEPLRLEATTQIFLSEKTEAETIVETLLSEDPRRIKEALAGAGEFKDEIPILINEHKLKLLEIATGPRAGELTSTERMMIIEFVVENLRYRSVRNKDRYEFMQQVSDTLEKSPRGIEGEKLNITRQFALAAMGSIVGTRALIEMMEDRSLSPELRQEAANAISRIQDEVAMGAERLEREYLWKERDAIVQAFHRFMEVERAEGQADMNLLIAYYRAYINVSQRFGNIEGLEVLDFVFAHFDRVQLSGLFKGVGFAPLTDVEITVLQKMFYDELTHVIEKRLTKMLSTGAQGAEKARKIAEAISDRLPVILGSKSSKASDRQWALENLEPKDVSLLEAMIIREKEDHVIFTAAATMERFLKLIARDSTPAEESSLRFKIISLAFSVIEGTVGGKREKMRTELRNAFLAAVFRAISEVIKENQNSDQKIGRSFLVLLDRALSDGGREILDDRSIPMGANILATIESLRASFN